MFETKLLASTLSVSVSSDPGNLDCHALLVEGLQDQELNTTTIKYLQLSIEAAKSGRKKPYIGGVSR